jgi:hypothetical protein
VSTVTTTRYRCNSCGNLTRFDVTTTRQSRAFHHYTVGGDLVLEEEEVLYESIDDVSCRWCGNGRGVEVLDESDHAIAAAAVGADPGPAPAAL